MLYFAGEVMNTESKHLIVLSSPSGGGKTTIARHLLSTFPMLKFSVSATTRKQRKNETDGEDYFFLTQKQFDDKINSGDFVEHEEIYGNFYGTLHSEIKKRLSDGEFILFDVDVKGAVSLKKAYPDETLLIFVSPPDFNTLERRLRIRSTETEEQLRKRLDRARLELTYANYFDFTIINDVLEDALKKSVEIVGQYIK